MIKMKYKIIDNFSGQFRITLENIPFSYQIAKVDKHVYRVNIFLDSNRHAFSKIGYALVKSGFGFELSKVMFTKNIDLLDYDYDLMNINLGLAIKGVKKLANLNISKIVRHGSKLAVIDNLKHELKYKHDDLHQEKNDINQLEEKLRNIEMNN